MGKKYMFLLMFLVLGAGLFAQVGSAFVDSRPHYATITIDNQARGNAWPTTIQNLSVGAHSIRLNYTGYNDYNGNFEIRANNVTFVNRTLQQIQQNQSNGTLNVTTVPSAASVYLNNGYMGTTPFRRSIAEGNYAIRITKQGYQDYNTNVQITANQRAVLNVTMNQSPQNQTGTLRVYSSPTYATVSVDGVSKGITRLNVAVTVQNLSEGNHALRVNKTGYLDYSGDVGITGNAITTLTANLTRNVGSLYVNSSPTGARVYLNGRAYSSTNTKINGLAAGNYALVLAKSGYRNYTQDIEIRAGQVTGVAANLERMPRGNLYIASNPSSARIEIGGVYNGYTPRTVYDLPAGNVAYVLKKAYYQDYPGSIEIIDGQTARVMATLVRIGINNTNSTNSTVAPLPAAPAITPAPAPVIITTNVSINNTGSLITGAITSVDDTPLELRRILFGS